MTRLILILALFAVAAQGQEQRDLERLWKMERLRIEAAHKYDLGSTITFRGGKDIMRWIMWGDTVYARESTYVFDELWQRATLRLYSEYEDDCRRDTVQDTRHVRDGMICLGTSYGWGDWPCNTPSHYDESYYRPRITPNGLDSNFIAWLRRK